MGSGGNGTITQTNMKEIIKHINGVAGRVVTVTGLTDPTMTRDNVLGILNGTQNEVLYVPMFYGDLLGVTYSDGTLTITLADNVKAIANGDKLFVKLYSDYSDSSQAAEDLAQFFGLPSALPEYQQMSEQEVMDTLEDIMGSLDTDLGETVEYPEGSGQYMTRAQAITAQVNLSINN